MTPLPASGDTELVNATLAGDREAFGQIVSRYQSLICSVAYSATGSLPQSEDLAQETFITAWKQLANLREPGKLRSWLCGIVRNVTHSALRKQGREPSHRAEALEDIAEPRSPEPLPVDHAISREEAEILWRSLEQIPETYREPLVLYYREHQSVEAVAQNLELTEEAVRQRLSRGKKLLQEEVLAFVEVALEKSAPGQAFTQAVVAALPVSLTTAKAASMGAALAKGGAGAKSALTLGGLFSLAAMLGAILFSWKTAVDESKSPRERQFMMRMAWFQIGFFVLSMGASFYLLPRFSQQPLFMGITLALLLLLNGINAVVMFDKLTRRRVQIGMEEGTWADAAWSGPGEETERKGFRKAVKLTIPFVFMFLVGSWGLPWKQHWMRSASIVAAEGLVIFWAFRRFQKQLSGQIPPRQLSANPGSSRLRYMILMPAILLGSALLGVGMVFFIQPGSAHVVLDHYRADLPKLGLCFLLAAAAYIVFAVIFAKRAGTMLNPVAALDKAIGPFFQEVQLTVDQHAQLLRLYLKKTMAGVTKGMSLMNPRLDAARRAALAAELKVETDDCAAEIRQALGEEHYLAFQNYEKTIPDRTMIDLFRGKLAGKAMAISPAQQEQLRQALSEARAQYNWSTDLSRRNQNTADYAVMLNEDNMNNFAQEEEQFDRQFIDRAREILSPQQLEAFQHIQEKQRKSQLTQMKLAARLFGCNRR